jgi:hypothetical protein
MILLYGLIRGFVNSLLYIECVLNFDLVLWNRFWLLHILYAVYIKLLQLLLIAENQDVTLFHILQSICWIFLCQIVQNNERFTVEKISHTGNFNVYMVFN